MNAPEFILHEHPRTLEPADSVSRFMGKRKVPKTGRNNLKSIRRLDNSVVSHLPPSEVSMQQEYFVCFCKIIGVEEGAIVTKSTLYETELLLTEIFLDGNNGCVPRLLASSSVDQLKLIRFHLDEFIENNRI